MKKYTTVALLFFCCLFIVACNTAPEKYFDHAVLTSNMMMGFAGNGMERELASPTVRMVDGNKDLALPMKRKEIVDEKIEYFETNLKNVRALRETDDTKEMLQASLALNEFILPVYKTEYVQLAKLYDEGAPKEQIQTLSETIHNKYYSRFLELFNKLTAAGKPFAARHNIKVNWME